MSTYHNERLWERFPEEIGKIAKTEQIYHLPVSAVMSAQERTAIYMPYIFMAKAAAENPDSVPKATETQVDMAKSMIRTTMCLQAMNDEDLQASLKLFDATWPIYRFKMLENPAFAKWVFESGTVNSKFLYFFYLGVNGFMPPVELLDTKFRQVRTFQMDTAFGEYHDALMRLCKIPLSDPAMVQIATNSLWYSLWYRSPYVQYFLRSLKKGAKVVDLCSGAFNAERRFNFMQANRDLGLQIVGYDTDPYIREALPGLFGMSVFELEQKGYCLRSEDFFNAFSAPDLVGQTDFVSMMGGLSYIRGRWKDVAEGISELLPKPRHGDDPKTCLVDVQLQTSGMAHSYYVLGLKNQSENLQPCTNEEEATQLLNDSFGCTPGLKIRKIWSDKGFIRDDVEPTEVLCLIEKVS